VTDNVTWFMAWNAYSGIVGPHTHSDFLREVSYLPDSQIQRSPNNKYVLDSFLQVFFTISWLPSQSTQMLLNCSAQHREKDHFGLSMVSASSVCLGLYLVIHSSFY
jgi:hypothetical protein